MTLSYLGANDDKVLNMFFGGLSGGRGQSGGVTSGVESNEVNGKDNCIRTNGKIIC
ncbi:MAG TPA: hypothetical protein VIC26_06110 [Marinagarivorans sp.]